MFHQFASQEERRSFGGSAFIELQFCKMPFGTKTKKLVSAGNIPYWQNDSLYICGMCNDDVEVFSREYKHIFDCGIYGNLKSGVFDIYGINYYAPDLTDLIIERIRQDKPTDYATLIDWLYKSKAYNGFYILGI